MKKQTVYTPIVIRGIVTREQLFRSFQIQLKEEGKSGILSDVMCEGVRMMNGSWLMVPYVFNQAIKGITYTVRARVISIDDFKSPWTTWKSITAGDVTPPDDVGSGNFSLVKKGIYLRAVVGSGYTLPSDFSHFEWYWGYESTDPIESTTPMDTSIDRFKLISPESDTQADTTIYVWVRVVDKSGNVSGWTGDNSTDTAIAIDNILVVKDCLIFK